MGADRELRKELLDIHGSSSSGFIQTTLGISGVPLLSTILSHDFHHVNDPVRLVIVATLSLQPGDVLFPVHAGLSLKDRHFTPHILEVLAALEISSKSPRLQKHLTMLARNVLIIRKVAVEVLHQFSCPKICSLYPDLITRGETQSVGQRWGFMPSAFVGCIFV